ncbi:hypothetical protein M407DRAFT_30058 [Tulasnella calospora MUT 4182]|uniref:Uncharacterized protein n=1 Tax=Tulasnella calospora MUT 4182 TaxID=1051891 RepID=A0A0C3Q7Y7_9AGAM|nr:hypothetical protein M407DRAFT_30058 [Tulasnella calospora MUT 4182]
MNSQFNSAFYARHRVVTSSMMVEKRVVSQNNVAGRLAGQGVPFLKSVYHRRAKEERSCSNIEWNLSFNGWHVCSCRPQSRTATSPQNPFHPLEAKPNPGPPNPIASPSLVPIPT